VEKVARAGVVANNRRVSTAEHSLGPSGARDRRRLLGHIGSLPVAVAVLREPRLAGRWLSSPHQGGAE